MGLPLVMGLLLAFGNLNCLLLAGRVRPFTKNKPGIKKKSNILSFE
jgi:hypothetical protein